MQFTGPALQGPMPSNSTSIRALGIRYKGFGEQREQRSNGTREYGNGANRTLSSYMTVAKPHSTSKPRTARSTSRPGRKGGDKFCPFTALLLIYLMSATTGGKVHMATDIAH